MYDVTVIGAGVIGGLTARALTRYRLKVCILERESDVAMGASGANSGIAHAGFDADTGTLKAKYNLLGAGMMPRVCEELGVKYRAQRFTRRGIYGGRGGNAPHSPCPRGGERRAGAFHFEPGRAVCSRAEYQRGGARRAVCRDRWHRLPVRADQSPRSATRWTTGRTCFTIRK